MTSSLAPTPAPTDLAIVHVDPELPGMLFFVVRLSWGLRWLGTFRVYCLGCQILSIIEVNAFSLVLLVFLAAIATYLRSRAEGDAVTVFQLLLQSKMRWVALLCVCTFACVLLLSIAVLCKATLTVLVLGALFLVLWFISCLGLMKFAQDLYRARLVSP